MTDRTEGWFRLLEDRRLEVFLKVGGLKVRASGTADQMNELADWFEDKTGMKIGEGVSTWRRPRRGPRPMDGQAAFDLELVLDEHRDELSSQDATVGEDA